MRLRLVDISESTSSNLQVTRIETRVKNPIAMPVNVNALCHVYPSYTSWNENMAATAIDKIIPNTRIVFERVFSPLSTEVFTPEERF